MLNLVAYKYDGNGWYDCEWNYNGTYYTNRVAEHWMTLKEFPGLKKLIEADLEGLRDEPEEPMTLHVAPADLHWRQPEPVVLIDLDPALWVKYDWLKHDFDIHQLNEEPGEAKK